MGRKADAEKQLAKDTEQAMTKIEEAARKQFERDQAEAEARLGKWVHQPETGYYYNAVHRWALAAPVARVALTREPAAARGQRAAPLPARRRPGTTMPPHLARSGRPLPPSAPPPGRWYYDYKTKWYYGGEPPTWTQQPPLTAAARFENLPKEGGPAALEEQQPAAAAAGAARPGPSGSAAAGGSGSSSSSAAAAAAAGPGAKVVKRVIQLPSHPQATIGGYQLPAAGKVGGAKGVGHSAAGGDAAAATAAAKRKREEEAAKGKGKVGGAAARLRACAASAQGVLLPGPGPAVSRATERPPPPPLPAGAAHQGGGRVHGAARGGAAAGAAADDDHVRAQLMIGAGVCVWVGLVSGCVSFVRVRASRLASPWKQRSPTADTNPAPDCLRQSRAQGQCRALRTSCRTMKAPPALSRTPRWRVKR
jgi:WW domain-binding protein 4